MTGQLFTHYFLTDGIKATTEWPASAAYYAAFRQSLAGVYREFAKYRQPNEAVTEQDLIRPVLELLGWTDYLPQQGADRNEDIPDHLLFTDAEAKAQAAGRPNPGERYRDAAVVEESKRFGLPLDARDSDDRVQSGTPHGQLLRYLSTADIESDGNIRWGILTNGRLWRLYDHRSRPRASGYFEADLQAILDEEHDDALRTFFLLFRREAFTLRPGSTATFLESAIAEGRRYEEQIAQDLSGVVFERVFPDLVQALADASGEELEKVRQAALVFLYRLLFVLYAEDRGLLPVNDVRYDDYGLRKRVRDDISRRMDEKDTFSSVAGNYYNRLIELFRMIDKGDPSIGLPPYNGGLFASDAAALLERVKLSDSQVAPIIYALSHTPRAQDPRSGRRFVNYRDMSVQQLGSIYERLLEREPVRDDDGKISVRPNPYARKDSGSFYTPQELVDLIVDHTLKPLVEERLQAFEETSRQLASERRPKPDRHAELLPLDPAEAVLDLKVLDPAMGSGHFLVTAVDFLSDYVADLIEYAPAVPEWLDDYASPLVDRVASIRRDILRRAKESRWIIDEAQLTDQAIIRRMVLKRCIYGVDKNPLTVELAKVSLWLHSFTVGAPLSFLDHHLRCGDSLIGLRVADATEDLQRLGGLFASSAIAGAEAATHGMQRIEEMSDADVSEVRESAALFRGVEDTTADLRRLLDFLCGMRWLTAGMKTKERNTFWAPVTEALGHEPAGAFALLSQGPAATGATSGDPEPAESDFEQRWSDAGSIADDESFLHWEVAFPGVWRRWQDARPEGGFDAVIGNPPWDHIKLQEVEWFATRDPALARAPTAAARKAAIERLRKQGDPLAADFDAAKARADNLGQLVRASGHYPLLGGGDANLFSLFVERATSLVRPDGFVGLLTPSGVYAGKTNARFFKSLSTSGRVAGLFDFENRRLGTDLPPFFPDVDSRFKFCALVFGGEHRRFDQTRCAFFLQDTRTIDDSERSFTLAPADFARVNPNTGTAPVFRTRRDADITRRIYERHPVLVDRSQGKERRAWPVRYNRMFDMSHDSHFFLSAVQLENEGFYPVPGNRWKRGDDLYVPLYEGKMIQAFDHRAASAVVNPTNLKRPSQARQATQAEHSDPFWAPTPRFWVPLREVQPQMQPTEGWTIAYRRVSISTNARTVISSIAPNAGFGDSVFLLMPGAGFSASNASSLVANLNSFSLDYVTRQKMHGVNLSLFLLEQLPVIAPGDYGRQFGNTTAGELVRDHVLRLTYTSHDMAPFARDLGYSGPPFTWDEEERRHLRARLDALYFHLYGLDREDAGYVLSTFPIVRRQDDGQFGRYRTRDLILAYMNALAAGDTETVVAV